MKAPITFIRISVAHSLRQPDMLFFTLILPISMYLLFGTMTGFEDQSIGHGNITASVMISMACFSVAVAAAACAGSAATDLAGGWGRQLALTRGGIPAFVLTKFITALVVSVVPLIILFVVGAATGAHIDSPARWLHSLILCLIVALPAATWGLALCMWLRTPRAIGIAAAAISAFAFAGNLFMPLPQGTLYTVAHYTPLFGAHVLSQWAISQGAAATQTSIVQESWIVAVANVIVWTVAFLLTCWAARNRQTGRR